MLRLGFHRRGRGGQYGSRPVRRMRVTWPGEMPPVRALVFLAAAAIPAFAQASPNEVQSLLSSVAGAKSAAAPRHTLTSDGYVRSLSSGPEGSFASPMKGKAGPDVVARAFVSKHARLFGATGADTQFTVFEKGQSSEDTVVHLQQAIGGMPVYNGRMVIQVDPNGGVRSVLSDILRGPAPFDADKSLLTPLISKDQAKVLARRLAIKAALDPDSLQVKGEPALVVYAPSVVGRPGQPALAWQVEVIAEAAAFGQRALIDARTGRVLYRFSLVHEAKNREVYDSNNTTDYLGTLRRSEGGLATGIADVDDAYEFLGDTYDFYFAEHGRDSIDGAGLVLSATVRYCDPYFPCPYRNAFWNLNRMHFGQGYATDDVTAHELTHGVTEYESNLDYVDESGAINESFSDMWGEFIDQTNGAGDDSAGVKWLMGEDIPGGGAIRDMADPTAFGDPDRYYSLLFFAGADVHINSGVGNKLCYLLTDGDTFNGRAITGLGISKTAGLFYEVQTNLLTNSSDYADLYTQLAQAAINLNFSAGERNTVERACRAVEIGGLPDGVNDFKANGSVGNGNITVTWTNPVLPATIKVVRKSGSYPTGPADGTLVYSGTGVSFVDGPHMMGSTYYYTAFAYYGLDEFGDDSYSPPARDRATAGIRKPDSYLAEYFGESDNDLDNTVVTFTPIGIGAYYASCSQTASSFPVDATTMTWLTMADDDSRQIALTGGKTVSLYGHAYSSVYIGSNGYLTFEGPDTSYFDGLAEHFALPRVSGLFIDFFPELGGGIGYRQMEDRFVVTYLQLPDYWGGASTSFQVEMFFDGRIRFTYLEVDAEFGVTGLSMGDWNAYAFDEVDMSDSAGCGEDHDSDGIPDYLEGSADMDNDALGNFEDSDSDGDGIEDAVETAADQDGDTIPNYLDVDSDGDGLLDEAESLAPQDVDGDAIPNFLDVDSDGDGVSDAVESNMGTDPYDANDAPAVPLPPLGIAAAMLIAGALASRRVLLRRRKPALG